MRTARRVGRDCGAATSVLVCGCLLCENANSHRVSSRAVSRKITSAFARAQHALAGIPNPTTPLL